jgi:hypothetical protein
MLVLLTGLSRIAENFHHETGIAPSFMPQIEALRGNRRLTEVK